MTIAISSAQPTNPPDPPDPGPGPTETLFEDNFTLSAGWEATISGNFTQVNPPIGWDAYKWTQLTGSNLGVDAGQGRNGTPAMRITYGLSSGQHGAITMVKHLTKGQGPDEQSEMLSGYDELYIQILYRFDNAFWHSNIPDPFKDTTAKWWRLWGNTHPTNQSSSSGFGGWSENRGNGFYGAQDTRFMIATMQSSSTVPHFYQNFNASAGLLNGNSATNATNCRYRWNLSGGKSFKDAIPDWEYDLQGEASPGFFKAAQQGWQRIQWHVKSSVSTVGPGDGIFEFWAGPDGGPMTHFQLTDTEAQTQTSVSGYAGTNNLCTSTEHGWNMFLLFDNWQSVNDKYTVEADCKPLYVDGITISENFIPHDYEPGAPS